jgi:hypothetical protein
MMAGLGSFMAPAAANINQTIADTAAAGSQTERGNGGSQPGPSMMAGLGSFMAPATANINQMIADTAAASGSPVPAAAYLDSTE